MATFLSPQVSRREISTGARAIQGVGTSVGGFIGLSEKGPIGQPRFISSPDQFKETFGDPQDFSFLSDSIEGFFANGGNSCWVVRTANYSDPASATLDPTDNARATLTLKDRSAGAGTDTLQLDAINEGDWANDVSISILQASGELGSYNRALGSDGGTLTANTSPARTPALLATFTEVSSVFSDITSDMKTVGGGSNQALPSVIGDATYYGSKNKVFSKLYFDLDVSGVAGAVTWQYWNGSSWALFSPTSDATSDFTAAPADNLLMEFTAPSDWQAVEVNSTSGFFIRSLVNTTYTTPAEISRITIGEDRPFGLFTVVADASTELAAATALDDAAYFGANQTFNFVELELATNGDAAGVLAWEYWNGTSWTAVSNITETATGASNMTTSGTVGFDEPTDWQKNTVNAEDFFWLRARITTNYASDYPSAEHALPASDLFRLQVREDGILQEDFDNLTMDSSKTSYVETRIGTTATPRSNFINATDLSSTATAPNNRPRQVINSKLTGGIYIVTNVNDGDFIGSAAGATGLFAFDIIDEINNIMIPGIKTEAVHISMLNYAESRGDVFMILDSPGDNDTFSPQDLVEYVRDEAALNSSYGAIYDYWIRVLDLISGTEKIVPPSGHLAGMYAKTDFNRGIWKSPAGVDDGRLFGALGVVRNTSKGERDLLYPNRINPIRDVGGIGVHSDGGKTLDTPGSDFDRIAIRRLFLFAEESIQEGVLFAKHEPNSETTRRRIRATINIFLKSLWQDGALNGEEPADAFFVICDETNNPPSLQRQFRLLCRIGIAPIFPAEFIDLTFEVDQRAINTELATFGLL